MGDANPEIKHQSSTNPQNKKNPSRFYSHFLFKTLIFTILLAIIPLFHSESPDFSAPQWELLYLIVVGIVVSYGLFSRRRNQDDLDGENNSKSENSHSYMSRLLQFPSVFDDEIETPSGFDDNNGNKYQTWSSRYHRNESMVVLAKRGSASVEKSRVSDEKPLLLPVRSLKSRASDESGVSRVFSRSNSLPTSDSDEDYETSRISNRLDSSLSSKGSLNDSRRSSVSSEFVYVDEDYETSRVSNRSNSSLSSTDSRRISREKSVNSRISVDESYETSRVTNRSNSSASSRNSKQESLKLQTSLPTEFGVSGSSRTLSNSSSRGLSGNSSQDLNRKHEDSDDEGEEEQDGKVSQSVILSSPIPWKSRSRRVEPNGDRFNDPITFSPLPPIVGIEHSPSFNSHSPQTSQSNASFSSTTKISSESQAKNVEDLGRRNINYSSRLPPPAPPPPPPPPRSMSAWSKLKRVSRENSTTSHNTSKEIVEEEEEPRNGIVSSVRSIRSKETISKEPFSEFPLETRDFLEGLLLETDDDSESEVDNEDIEKTEKLEEESPSDSVTDEGPDVDKKADEFIAKFREQIRLQRIASIKRSTGELKRSSIS